MKRIALSLSMLIFVGSLTAGATGAFFTDAQTSSSNIFTAGSVHLTIDHSLSTYNGQNVAQDLVVVSDPTTTFVGDDGNTPASGNAVDLTFVHPAWVTIPGANWIWATDPVSDPANTDQEYTFTRTFTWNGPVTSATIEYAADNYYDVTLNGQPIGDDQNLDTTNFNTNHQTDVAADIVQGTNTLTFIGKNQHIAGSDYQSNPAGIVFRIEVQGLTLLPNPVDLSGAPFWNFDDVKPMDQGYDVFSLHEETNDAWACMEVTNIDNEENSYTQPEIDAGDTTPGPGPTSGELGEFLHLFAWIDKNGDGLYEPGDGETALTSLSGETFTGPSFIIPINDSTHNGVLPGGGSEDVGTSWCMGDMSVNPTTGAITCADAGPTENQAQTDSTTADLTFYATQARNQPNFSCSSLQQCTVDPNNLVADGGFESPVVTNAATWDIFPSPVDGWIVQWNADDATTFDSSNRPAIANLELQNNTLGTAYEGSQYTELDSDWDGPSGSLNGEPASVTISQAIATIPGATYDLHFAFAPRPNTTADENELGVTWGGVAQTTVGPVAGGSSLTWSTYDYTVTATTTSTEISFSDLGTPDSIGTLLDDVEVTQQSCPATNL